MRSLSKRASHVLFSAVVGVASFAVQRTTLATTISGTVDYTDFDSNAVPVRDGLIDIFSTNGTTQTLLGTAATDPVTGGWSANFTAPAGATGFVATALAQNDGSSVSDGVDPVYSVSLGTIPVTGGSTGQVTINTQTGGDSAKAFMLADALYTSYLYSGKVRASALPSLPAIFGPKSITGIDDGDAYFSSSDGEIHIGEGSVYDWDTMNHEYGHYMAFSDNLDQNAGGTHGFGSSDIITNQRFNGVKLAWGEALATYNGISAQQQDPTRPNSFGNQNLSYDFFDNTMPPGTYIEQDNINNTASGKSVGEGDELSVVRIVWELANPTTDPHDRVNLGYKTVYTMLATQHFNQLGGLWNYLATAPGTTDAMRVNYGGIFQANSVSPDPTNSPVNGTILTPTSTFSWLKGNDDGSTDPTTEEANDVFDLIVFNADFTDQLLNIVIPGDVTSYTLTPAQYAILDSTPGVDEYVITGEDDGLHSGTANASTDPGVIDAAYWSDAYSFTVASVPEPTSLGLIAMTGIGLLARRRSAAANV